jgi:hypothetical protein
MLYLERKKLTFRKIKYQTTVLQIQQPDGTTNEITNIEDIHEKVSQYNFVSLCPSQRHSVGPLR